MALVILYKKREKVCEICEGKKACNHKGKNGIMITGEQSPAIRRNTRTNRFVKTNRKEKMEEELLFGKYRILDLIANGSGGEVFLAEHKVLGEKRIIKRLLKNRPFYEERKQEAHTLKLLHHAAIPRIYDIEEDETACYIIEEDMGGETLNNFLMRQKCLSTSLLSHYSIQLCEIIEYLHRNGILYLDVKPENVMICGDKLALIDFGGAIRKSEYSGVMFGTKGYAAPEQYNGMAKEYSDVFGIGCVIGAMLHVSGRGNKELVGIYERCVQENPVKRYADVSVLKRELQRVSYGKSQKRPKKCMAPKYIGVTGVHEGAESGALCTLLTAYFNERENGRIVCIDLSGQHIFERLYERLFGDKKSIPECFWLRNVCYVTEGNQSVIGSYAAKNYTTIILHFGVFKEQFRNEFFRCDSRFVLGCLYPWRLQDWEELSVSLNDNNIQYNVTAVITGGEKELLPVRFHKVIELPFVGDVLCVERKTEKIIRTAL